MKRSINLVARDTQSRLAARRWLRRWAMAWLALLAGLGALGAAQWLSLNDAARAAEQLERRQPTLSALQARGGQLKRQLDALLDGQSLIAQLEPEQLAYQVLAAVSGSAARCGGRIQLQQLALARSSPEAPADREPRAAADPQDPSPGQPAGAPLETPHDTCLITLKGMGVDNLAIARFVAALRDCQLFERVELRSALGGTESNVGGRHFVIECAL